MRLGLIWPWKWVGMSSRTTYCLAKILMDIHEKFWYFGRRKSGSPTKMACIVHDNRKNWGMRTSGLVWLWKRVGMSARVNWMHRQGHNGHQLDLSAFCRSKLRIHKNDDELQHTIIRKIGVMRNLGLFVLENWPAWTWGPTGCIAKSLRMSMRNFGI